MTRRRPKLALCPFCQGRPEFDTGLLDAQFPKGQEFIVCQTIHLNVPGVGDIGCGHSAIGAPMWNFMAGLVEARIGKRK